MFERKSQPFSYSRFWVVGVLMIGLLVLILTELNKEKTTIVPIERGQGEEAQGAGLRPHEDFFALREYPDFQLHTKAYREAMLEAANANQSRNGFKGFSAPWKTQGPFNIGARINSIAVHPNNPNTIYIGYSVGGLWKTTNGGQTWNPIFDGQQYTAIGDIVFDPNDPNTIFVGTGDPNISGYPFIGDGIWKSTDAGQTWTNIGLEETAIVAEIRVHPTNSDIIYAATMGLPFERNSDRGLYKTTDGGATWSKMLYIGEETGTIDLEMDPNNPNVLYAAAWDRIRNNQESLVLGPNAKIWKSGDGGDNWTMLGGGLPNEERSRIGLCINPQNPNQLSAVVVADDLYLDNIYQSNNGGQSWDVVGEQSIDHSFLGGFGWYFGGICYNPHVPNQLWALGVRSQRSDDNGQTWYTAFDWGSDVHVDHHDMAFIDANTYLIATDGGLYKTTNGGVDWAKIEDIPTTQFYRTAWNPHSPEYYYGGAQDNGTVTGNSLAPDAWWRVNGGDGFQAAFHPTNPNIFYYEYQNGGIVGTTDGYEIESATEGIEFSDRRSWDMQYLISPNDPNVMLTGTYRLYRSTTHLPYWIPMTDDLTDGTNSRYHVITTLDESRLTPNLTYVGTSDGNVWQGNAQTGQFTNISAGLPDRYISCVKASPTAPNRVFVSVTGYKDNDDTPHIFRSNDKGSSWQSIAGNLPNLAINDILVLPGNADSILFVATDGGVYGTKNGGQYWERLGAGMPQIPVYDLCINENDRTLAAGTFARSIMTFPLDSLAAGGDVSTFNPTGDGAANLKVRSSVVSHQVEINVYNLQAGHTSDLLVTDLGGNIRYQTQFEKDKNWNSSIQTGDWNSGVYIVFVRTNGRLWAHQKFMKF